MAKRKTAARYLANLKRKLNRFRRHARETGYTIDGSPIRFTMEGVLDSVPKARFLDDMIYRLERKKALSPRRREWLDTIIGSPLPEAKNKELWERITKAGNAHGLDSNTRQLLLNDFAIKAFRGWSMSEKQAAFLNRLLDRADDVLKNGPYCPSDKTITRMKLACQFATSRDSAYWRNRPGEMKAYSTVFKWLACIERDTDPFDQNIELSEWHVNKLFHSSRVPLREVDNPKFVHGAMVNHRGNHALVVAGPHPGRRGEAYYTLLVGGDMIESSVKDIRKRLKKN